MPHSATDARQAQPCEPCRRVCRCAHSKSGHRARGTQGAEEDETSVLLRGGHGPMRTCYGSHNKYATGVFVMASTVYPERGFYKLQSVPEGASTKGLGAAVNKDDAMQLCSIAELTDPYAEYHQADVLDYLVNDQSLGGDIDQY